MTSSKKVTQSELEQVKSHIDRINEEFRQALARIPKGIPLRVGDEFVTDKQGRVVAYFPVVEQS